MVGSNRDPSLRAALSSCCISGSVTCLVGGTRGSGSDAGRLRLLRCFGIAHDIEHLPQREVEAVVYHELMLSRDGPLDRKKIKDLTMSLEWQFKSDQPVCPCLVS